MTDPLRPRRTAASIVGRVIREGAYSNVLLDNQTTGLDRGEAARVKALVYGVIRTLPDLDRHLEAASNRGLGSVENQIADLLRLAAFEIRYSDVPSPVAVSVGVDLVREVRPKAAGLANAILRRVSESTEPDLDGLELPGWLQSRLQAFWSRSEIDDFARASATEPPRVGRSRSAGSAGGTAVDGVPGAFVLEPGLVDEGYHIQDSASIAVGNLVRAEPGMTVLDVAAAPGGKTSHLVDQVGPGGTVVASDSHVRRVESSRGRVPDALWLVADGRRLPFRRSSFDRILVDAPCTGLGTLRRRPEILYRVGPEDVERLAVIQRQILEASIPLLKEGGELIYSVCTVTPEETIGVVSGLGFSDPGGPGAPVDGGRLMAPHTTGSDGMFFARYRT